MKRIFSLLLSLFLIPLLFSCAKENVLPPPAEQAFEKDGFFLTLDSRFSLSNSPNAHLSLSSEEVAVFAIRSPFSDYENSNVDENTSLSQWISYFLNPSNPQTDPLSYSEKDSLFYTDRIEEESGIRSHHRTFYYKGSDAFWIVDFSTREENFPLWESSIFSWAKSVTLP